MTATRKPLDARTEPEAVDERGLLTIARLHELELTNEECDPVMGALNDAFNLGAASEAARAAEQREPLQPSTKSPMNEELETKRQAVIDAAKFFCGDAIPHEVCDPFTPLEQAVAALTELKRRLEGASIAGCKPWLGPPEQPSTADLIATVSDAIRLPENGANYCRWCGPAPRGAAHAVDCFYVQMRTGSQEARLALAELERRLGGGKLIADIEAAAIADREHLETGASLLLKLATERWPPEYSATREFEQQLNGWITAERARRAKT